MSTFAVFGMTRDQALAEARKTVKTTRKTPQFAREFMEVARRTLKCRSLHIRFRSSLNDETGKLIINKKTGAPVVTWQDYRHD